MTTENSTTPSLHFYRQAGGPQKDQPSPELSVRFHVFASGQEFEKEGAGGVCPISIEHCRPRFLFCSFVSSERPLFRTRWRVVTELGEPENRSLSALIQHPILGSPATDIPWGG